MRGFILGVALVLGFIYRHELVQLTDEIVANTKSYHNQELPRLKSMRQE